MYKSSSNNEIDNKSRKLRKQTKINFPGKRQVSQILQQVTGNKMIKHSCGPFNR
jgi:hypothetical protein